MSTSVSSGPAGVAGLDGVRATLSELREQRLAWDRDVAQLFDEFDSLAVQLAVQSVVESVPASPAAPVPSGPESGHAAQELASMREMMAQQMELLTAFIGAATRFGNTAPIAAAS